MQAPPGGTWQVPEGSQRSSGQLLPIQVEKWSQEQIKPEPQSSVRWHIAPKGTMHVLFTPQKPLAQPSCEVHDPPGPAPQIPKARSQIPVEHVEVSVHVAVPHTPSLHDPDWHSTSFSQSSPSQ
jgi:hypothetical protein